MKIEFAQRTHTYIVDGDIASISVTELLHKHGLAPDYECVPKDRLKKAQDDGKAIHKDLELLMNEVDHEPTTEQGKTFLEWSTRNLSCGVGEQMLAMDYKGIIIAGTADLMAFGKDNEPIIADYKTTSVFQEEYVTWQVSLLDYMARWIKGEKVNGKRFVWKGAKKFLCLLFDKRTGGMKEKELTPVPDAEIERLLEAEAKNEKYTRSVLSVPKDLQEQVEEAEIALQEAKIRQQEAEEHAAALRQRLLEEMRKQNILSWDTGKIRVTYIPEAVRTTVDSKKLKSNFPQVYSECVKMSKVKEQVRITIREDE